jgi:hypothetical protein
VQVAKPNEFGKGDDDVRRRRQHLHRDEPERGGKLPRQQDGRGGGGAQQPSVQARPSRRGNKVRAKIDQVVFPAARGCLARRRDIQPDDTVIQIVRQRQNNPPVGTGDLFRA